MRRRTGDVLLLVSAPVWPWAHSANSAILHRLSSSARAPLMLGGTVMTPLHVYGAGRYPRHHPGLCRAMTWSPAWHSQAPQRSQNVLLV